MMSRYDGGYGRSDFGAGDFGLFGGYASMPPTAGPGGASFASAPPPPSLMSLAAVPPLMPPVAAVPPPMASQQAYTSQQVYSTPSMVAASHHISAVPSGPVGALSAAGRAAAAAGVNTNSRHPLAMKARVFIGNLNTNVVTRDEIENLYQRFGEVVAVSLHRGYAFVQFSFEHEARNAISFTDGMILGGQRLDVNLAAEPKGGGRDPKSRRTETSVPEPAAKRARYGNEKSGGGGSSSGPKPLFPKHASTNISLTSSGKSSARSNAKTSTNLAIVPVTTTTTPKKPETTSGAKTVATTANKTLVGKQQQSQLQNGADSASAAKPANTNGSTTGDILICGHCRLVYDTVGAFLAHKKSIGADADSTIAAENSSVSTATTKPAAPAKPDGEPDVMLCFICQNSFEHAWHLISHISSAHQVVVFRTNKTENKDTGESKATESSTTKSAPIKQEIEKSNASETSKATAK